MLTPLLSISNLALMSERSSDKAVVYGDPPPVGPKRTRLAAQVVAAVIGASFVIGVQFAAILSLGVPGQIVFLQSEAVVRSAPDIGSVLWWPAHAIRGDLPALAIVIGFGASLLAAAIWIFAPRFGRFALATAGVVPDPTRRRG